MIAGFSATPAFNDEQDLHLLLGEENEVVNVSAKRLREDGIIAPATNYVYAVSIEGVPPKGGAGSPAMKRLSVRSGLDFYENYRDPDNGQRMIGKPTLGYCSDIEQAKLAAMHFNRRYRARGLKAAVLTGHDSSARQSEILRRLADGEIHAVMNVKLLQEGIDVPCVRNVVNFAATSSAVRASQRGGRGVRWDFDRPDADQNVAIVDCDLALGEAEHLAPAGADEPGVDPAALEDAVAARIEAADQGAPGAPQPLAQQRRGDAEPLGHVSPGQIALLARRQAADHRAAAVPGAAQIGHEGQMRGDLEARLAGLLLLPALGTGRGRPAALLADEARHLRVRMPDGPVPAKTADWRTLSEVRAHFKISTLNKEVSNLFDGWHADLLAGRNPKLGGRLVQVEFRQAMGPKVCIHRSELAALAEYAGLEHRGTESDWLRRDRLRELAGEGVDRILNGVMADLAAGRQPYVAGVAIKAKLLGEDRIIRVHRSSLKAIMRGMKEI